jgi:hypothetical protein
MAAVSVQPAAVREREFREKEYRNNCNQSPQPSICHHFSPFWVSSRKKIITGSHQSHFRHTHTFLRRAHLISLAHSGHFLSEIFKIFFPELFIANLYISVAKKATRKKKYFLIAKW